MEDSQLYEKVRKESEDARIDSAYKLAHSVHTNMDDYQFRKTSFFIKLVNALANNRLKYPGLGKKLNFN